MRNAGKASRNYTGKPGSEALEKIRGQLEEISKLRKVIRTDGQALQTQKQKLQKTLTEQQNAVLHACFSLALAGK